ncbi:hypothetical protein CPB84DRAFT_235526 [Gymnopilus junonius]|uniref:Uncharacterized protein n=1 Tax=Gymnopilus junonius TaxID=109634 RepID=A0A9P5TIG3_GYMJU|nr:hypothetical protein CPB84DRAFT_235526 [Gymnopilus junonius]
MFPPPSPDTAAPLLHNALSGRQREIAVLACTNRQFYDLLRNLKFRSVTITLNVGIPSSLFTLDRESSARRFAETITRNPDILKHIEILRIGHEHHHLPVTAHKWNDDDEQISICFILMCQYPSLKHLTLSMRSVAKITHPLYMAIQDAFSLPSLSEVSIFAASFPPDLLRELEQIHTLNVRYFSDLEPTSLSQSRKKCMPRTLRVHNENARLGFFSLQYPPRISLECLTSLVLVGSTSSSASFLKYLLSQTAFPLKNLKNLKLFFLGPPGKYRRWQISFDLRKITTLKDLTLGFSILDYHSNILQEQFQWIVGILDNELVPTVETIHLFIGNVDSQEGWLERIEGLPWTNFEAIFLSESNPSPLQKLQLITKEG